eukprot:10604351-Ditylum_brightwellii.AAC.2
MTGKLQNWTCDWMAGAAVPNSFSFDTVFVCCEGDIGMGDVWNLLGINVDSRDMPCMDIEAEIVEAKLCVGAIETGFAVFTRLQEKEKGNEE